MYAIFRKINSFHQASVSKPDDYLYQPLNGFVFPLLQLSTSSYYLLIYYLFIHKLKFRNSSEILSKYELFHFSVLEDCHYKKLFRCFCFMLTSIHKIKSRHFIFQYYTGYLICVYAAFAYVHPEICKKKIIENGKFFTIQKL